MKKSVVISFCGLLLMMLSSTMVLPLIVSLIDHDWAEVAAFGESIAITLFAGAVAYWGFRQPDVTLKSREGFAIVAVGWAALSAFGALPFWLAPHGIPSYLDAYFETISGFTTTGASVVEHIEPQFAADGTMIHHGLSRGVLFWRSLTHWLGGMGIVVLTVAILPFLGAGGYQMLRAEVPGPTADKLQPRIAQTAKLLWFVYVLLTVAEIALLLPVMGWFDATCHAFGTLATGGFATKDASLAHYDSVYVDLIVTVFMILAGTNFVLHYRFLVGKGIGHLRDSEFRLYFSIIIGATIFIAAFLYWGHYPDKADPDTASRYESLGDCARHAAFQVGSIVTTTGYVTADYDSWPNPVRVVIALLMIFGGCAGSTGGGVKMVRILVLVRYGIREVRRVIRPHAILPLKIGGHTIEREVVARVMGFLALYLVIFFLSVFAMTLILEGWGPPTDTYAGNNHSLITAFGAVLATIGNIGPGFAGVGPMENFAELPGAAKILCMFCMLVGRLEIYAVLVVMIPLTWRR